MTEPSIRLGFEVESGEPVGIPVQHLAVTGQTQQSGKTTTLAGLIARAPADYRFIAFKTKRGEINFSGAREIAPHFQDGPGEGRPYWEFVEELLVSAMRQKMKFERAWIVKAAEGARSLKDVRANVARLQSGAKRAMDKDLFMLLGEYLDIVLPQIERMPRSSRLSLSPGLNVMDLTALSDEMQQLVVRSVIEWVHRHERGVIVIVPEAWKFLPETKNTPVKPAAERLIREGAALGLFMWVDSQDIAGVWKLVLRACTVWIVGVQRERNEVKRTLDQIPEHTHKPKTADVMKLRRGEFYACFGETVRRVYVQPAWLGEGAALAVARGERAVEEVARPLPVAPRADERELPVEATPAKGGDTLAPEERQLIQKLSQAIEDLSGSVAYLSRKIEESGGRAGGVLEKSGAAAAVDEEQLVSRVLARLPPATVYQVEPKEAVLKEYQRRDVERLLAAAAALTPWQKDVLRFVEAKGTQVEKPDLLRQLLGKKSASLVSDYKQRYADADELAEMGFLRRDTKGRLSPNLADYIKERLGEYRASEQEIEEVIGQFLLRLKPGGDE